MRQKFIDYLRFEKRYSEHTLKAYDTDLRMMEAFLRADFEIDAPEQCEQVHLRSWVASMMEAEASPRSINRKISSARSFFKWCIKYNGLAGNPAADLLLPKVARRLPTYVEEGQMEALFPSEVFPESYNGLRDRAVIELFYHTGMRSAELTELKKNAFDSERGTIKVLGKRNKERMVPVGESISNLLAAYEKERDALPIIKDRACFFLTETGTKLYPKLVYRLVNHYLGSVSSLQKKSPHVLRHTFATHMLNKGADLNAIKELLGHASLAATQVYTHNSIEKLKEIHRKAHPKG